MRARSCCWLLVLAVGCGVQERGPVEENDETPNEVVDDKVSVELAPLAIGLDAEPAPVPPQQPEAPEDPVDVEEPFVAPHPAGEWTFVGGSEHPLAEPLVCMDGTTSGFGVNPSPTGARDVLFFFQGGGACFDAESCFITEDILTAGHFQEDEFAAFAQTRGVSALFNRSNFENPLRDYTFVFMPYCSGDVFSGANPLSDGGRVHMGYSNVGRALDAIAPYTDRAQRVVVAGTSAGGFGAAFNAHRIAGRVPGARVTLLSDSAPVMNTDVVRPCLQERWRSTWNMDLTLPPESGVQMGFLDDGTPASGIGAMVPWLLETRPDINVGFISSEEDQVIRLFFGFGFSLFCSTILQLSGDFYSDGLSAFQDELAGFDNTSFFRITGQKHQWLLTDEDLATEVRGVRLSEWIRQLVDEEPPVASVLPD